MMTEEELEAKALADHAAVAGKLIRVRWVYGYDDRDDLEDIWCDPPALCRVDPVIANERQLKRWIDEWIDPRWDLSLVEPHPELKGIRSLWMYGPSYNVETGGCDRGEWELYEPGPAEQIRIRKNERRLRRAEEREYRNAG
jgi:hypothetical protein